MSKAALITGAARRVGRELALSLARQGYDIALHYHHSHDEAQATLAEIQAMGRQAQTFAFDLNDVDKIDPWLQEITKHFPSLELLVNNASIFERKRLMESDLALFERHMRLNATAPIFLTQAFAKHAKSGHVVNMLDTDVSKTHGSHFFYLLAKKTLAEFTTMAARELGPEFRVNGICIGSVLPSPENPADHDEKLAARVPLQTLIHTTDITRALEYLVASPHVTGQLLFTDSGQHLL